MKPNGRKIAVIGAGAIGGVTAAFMKKAGWDPVLVCKHADTLKQVTSPGLSLTGLKGTHTVPLRAVLTVADLPEDLEIVFHATKANDCVAVARELRPRLHAESIVVSLQNGISEEALADVLGRERVAGCVVGWGATNGRPGQIEVTSDGEFILGNIDHQPDARLDAIQPMLDAVQPTRISDNIMGELYAKLMINACINTLGAITGVTLGELLAVRKIRSIFIALMQEALAVANAMQIRVEPATGGKLDYYEFLAGNGLIKQFKRHLVIRLIGFKYRRIRSSSLQSLERGRPTEIDYLNGYICDRAAEHTIPVPVNQAVVAMIKEIEAGERQLSMANMEDPVFGGF
jgi:2-dehydropantoate 2-reductase